jgi:hypothetical protein
MVPARFTTNSACRGFRLASELSLSVRITDFIPYRAKVIHDRLAVSEDGFKNLLLVLMRRQVQILRRERPKFWKIDITVVRLPGLIQYVFANTLQQHPCGRDCPFRISYTPIEGLLPGIVNMLRIEVYRSFGNRLDTGRTVLRF